MPITITVANGCIAQDSDINTTIGVQTTNAQFTPTSSIQIAYEQFITNSFTLLSGSTSANLANLYIKNANTMSTVIVAWAPSTASWITTLGPGDSSNISLNGPATFYASASWTNSGSFTQSLSRIYFYPAQQ